MPSLGNDDWNVFSHVFTHLKSPQGFESLGVTFLGHLHKFRQAKLHKESRYGCMTLGIKAAIARQLPSENEMSFYSCNTNTNH